MLRLLARLLRSLLLVLIVVGCQGSALQISERAADRQAEQNRVAARLQQDVAAGTRELLKAEAVARQDHLGQSKALARERAELSEDLRELAGARTQLSQERSRDSLVAGLLQSGGGLLIVLFSLAFAWLALFALRYEEPIDPAYEALLLEELTQGDASPPPASPAPSRLTAPDVEGEAIAEQRHLLPPVP